MNWAVRIGPHIDAKQLTNDVDAAVLEAFDLGRELAAALYLNPSSVLLIFRPMVRPVTHVTATLRDRDGYAR